jgi:hypothetical protein
MQVSKIACFATGCHFRLPPQELAQATSQRVTGSVCLISGAVLAFRRFPHVQGAHILFVALA